MDEEFKEHINKLKAYVTPENVTRTILKGIAKHSVGFVAAKLANTYCPTENKKQELQVTAGAYVIGGMAGDAAANWAEQEFNEAYEFVKKVVEGIKQKDVKEEPKLRLTAE